MSRSRFILRTATPADVPAADALERATFTKHAISRRQIRYLQRSPQVVFLVATLGRRFAGDAIGLLRRHPGGTISARVYSIVVDPTLRGRRIGQKLLRGLIRVLRARGANRIYLEVETKNTAARRLYERLGFRTIKRKKHYYGRGKHGLQMCCDTAI